MPTRKKKVTRTKRPAIKPVAMYRVKVRLTQTGTSRCMTADQAKKMRAQIKRRTPNASVTITKE